MDDNILLDNLRYTIKTKSYIIMYQNTIEQFNKELENNKTLSDNIVNEIKLDIKYCQETIDYLQKRIDNQVVN